MSQHHLLPSNKPGHHWSLLVYRTGRGQIIATAQEGTASVVAGLGCTSFSFAMFSDRREQIVLAGVKRLTEKAIREGLAKMHAHLREKGLLEGAAAPAEPAPLDPMRPALVRLVGKLKDGPVACPIDDMPIADAVAALPALGYALDKADEPGGRVLRDELKHRPTFKGLAGPMWGGVDKATGLPIIRYETWAAYERLSA
jgi:hypothetical protein